MRPLLCLGQSQANRDDDSADYRAHTPAGSGVGYDRVDPFGYLHICQGISMGNIFHSSLEEICQSYNPDKHPITNPLLDGGPAELNKRYKLFYEESYADACHLCYEARKPLRERYPEILTPDQMYGVPEE